MHIVLHLAVLSLTIFGLSRWLPNVVHIRSAWTAAVVAVVFSVLNFFLGWALGLFLKAVLFVPALFTLGALFLFVPFIVNTVLLWLTDKALASFEIVTTRALLLSAAVITLVNAVFFQPVFQRAWTYDDGRHPAHHHSQPRWI
ncbi:MAG: phage holin family protein [Polyangiaceae bacterium]|nr:phage holin family protein [Polyangiaceae bacterium]